MPIKHNSNWLPANFEAQWDQDSQVPEVRAYPL